MIANYQDLAAYVAANNVEGKENYLFIDEVYDMGYEDYFYSGNLCFLEWPELIEDLLPEDCTKVTITAEEDGTRSVEW